VRGKCECEGQTGKYNVTTKEIKKKRKFLQSIWTKSGWNKEQKEKGKQKSYVLLTTPTKYEAKARQNHEVFYDKDKKKDNEAKLRSRAGGREDWERRDGVLLIITEKKKGEDGKPYQAS